MEFLIKSFGLILYGLKNKPKSKCAYGNSINKNCSVVLVNKEYDKEDLKEEVRILITITY